MKDDTLNPKPPRRGRKIPPQAGQPTVIKRAAYGSLDKPLVLGERKVPCFVLDDGTRVVTADGFLGGVGYAGNDLKNLSLVLGGIAAKNNDPRFKTGEKPLPSFDPIPFKMPNGAVAQGIVATLFADVCGLIVDAWIEGRLRKNQANMAKQCQRALIAFGKVGIVALIDEATGYQHVRKLDELRALLAEYVDPKAKAWVSTFPPELMNSISKMRGWRFDEDKHHYARCMGQALNDLVYERMLLGLDDELDKVNPADPTTGQRSRKKFQHFREGKPADHLKIHLAKLMMLAEPDLDWPVFKARVDHFLPKPDANRLLPGMLDIP